jgi:syntaxin 1B/2/3
MILTLYFQAALLKDKFQAALQNYQQVEQRQRNASKNQMERQYRIGETPAFDHNMAFTDRSSRLLF